MAHRATNRFPLDNIDAPNLSELARRTGYTLRTIQRWRIDGIPYWSADRVAIRLGIHPALIWTDWYATPTRR
jgi:lambda repressor-like predicted transcriptional regulator